MTTRWHPINEIPPIDSAYTNYSTTVLLIGSYGGARVCFSGYYCHLDRSWSWYGMDDCEDFKPTHWCDLPTPPEVIR